MRLTAHRGFADASPENTVEAFRNAATIADAVEFDVRRCGSGELVVIHDDTVDRVTDDVGRVADYSLEELRALSVLDSGERIPTLAEALAAVPREVDVNLEMKETGIAADVLRELEGRENRVVVTSFLPEELRAVRDLDTDRPIGLLVNNERDRAVTTAVELGADVLGANYWRCLFTRLPERAHDVDLEVHAWSIRRRPLARILEWRGVDAVSSDRPLAL